MPVIIKGTKKIIPAEKSIYLLPGCVTLQVLPPVKPEADAESLKQKVFEMNNSLIYLLSLLIILHVKIYFNLYYSLKNYEIIIFNTYYKK
jgi:hypothetical protein